MCHVRTFPALVVFLMTTVPVAGTEVIDRDEQFLRQARLNTDSASLVEFLRQRARADQDAGAIKDWIAQLGSDRFAEREGASRNLNAAGPRAVPLLRKAASDLDPEVVRRARDCLKQLERNAHADLPSAVVRLLSRRRSAGTVEALLAYLPGTDEEEVEEEILHGLISCGNYDGKSVLALVAALKDSAPRRRAAAGCVLARLGGLERRAMVRPLLTDREPLVRLRIAQGLLASGDREMVPVLTTLLEKTPVELAWQAEELLHWAAGESAPQRTVGGGDAPARKQCRLAWEDWWRVRGNRLDLGEAQRAGRRPGLVLVHEAIRRRGAGQTAPAWSYRVWVGGCDGRPRWQLANVPALADLQWLSGGRLLAAERENNRVNEHNLSGKLLRQKEVEDSLALLACQRLSGDHLFIATTDRVLEIGSREETIFSHPLNRFHPVASTVRAARKRGDGRIVCVTDDGSVLEVDPVTGLSVRALELKAKPIIAPSIRILGDDRFLVPVDAAGRFREVGATGERLAEYTLPYLRDAVRLGDGCILSALAPPGSGRLIEFDAAGTEIWRTYCEGEPYLIRDCLRLVRFGFDRSDRRGAGDPVDNRVRELSRRHLPTRRGAASDLAELGPQARGATRALVAALGDTDAEVRRAAGRALAEIGPAAWPEVVRALQATAPGMRAASVSLLSRFESAARIAAPEIIELLRDDDSAVRAQAVQALAASSPDSTAEPHLRRLLSDTEPEVRRSALAALGQVARQSPTARRALLDVLNGEDPTLRRLAATALGRIGPSAKAAVPDLIKAAGVLDTELRAAALNALAGIGPAAKAAVPFLIGVLKDGDADLSVRTSAAHALGGIGPDARSGIPVLKDVIETSAELPLTRAAYTALGRLGPEAVLVLIELLRKRDPQRGLDGSEAIHALGAAGSAAKRAVPELLRVWEERSPFAFGRQLVPYALADIGPEAKTAIPKLIESLKKRDGVFDAGILHALSRIGPNDKEVFAAVLAVLKDHGRTPALRALATLALGRMKPEAGDAVPPLIEAVKRPDGPAAALSPDDRRNRPRLLLLALGSDDQAPDSYHEDVRACACLALGRIGVRAAPAASAVSELLADKKQETSVRIGAAWAIGRFGPATRTSIVALVGVLADPDAPVELRCFAAASLSRVGPETVPALRSALRSPNWCTRYWALESLAAMGPAAVTALPAIAEIARGGDKLLARTAAFARKKVQE